jgi:chromosome segregation protein
MVFSGPNGSGKSNIFDAIKFVLGDLSARSLRASKMSEVIFDGIPNTPASKSAYVNLRLDNSDRKLPMDREIVTIGRRVNRHGISRYLLNGRTVSRNQIVNLLSMAGLYSSGYNMVMQGTITKLAEITPDERRKVIEDFVGISEYNTKKNEARVHLRQAETNLRIADARIGDVQSRLENLEEERNDAFRYQFIQDEIRKLEAVLVSSQLAANQDISLRLTEQYGQEQRQADSLKHQRQQLQDKRREIETARRDFDKHIATQGNQDLIRIQQQIGNSMATIARLKSEIEASKINLRRFTKLRLERIDQLKTLNSALKDARTQLSRLTTDKARLDCNITETQTHYTRTAKEFSTLKHEADANRNKLQKIEDVLRNLEKQQSDLDSQLHATRLKDQFLSTTLSNMEERRKSFESSLTSLEANLTDFTLLHKAETQNISRITHATKNSFRKKEELVLEIDGAQKTARTAKDILTELEVQRELLNKVASEETALQTIEEMGEVGAIPGIYGRLHKLVKINKRFHKALNTASQGWNQAIVVKDVVTALRCIESLKRLQRGRIKLLPLTAITNVPSTPPPKINGVIGLATDFVRTEKQYQNIVAFVFGDTIVTSGEKSAFLVAKAGFRAVDLQGNLYEPGGGIESGFYRAPIDIAALAPSGKAVDGLSQSVTTLEQLLSKSRHDLSSLDQEIHNLREDYTQRSNVLTIISKDIDIVTGNIDRTRQNLHALNRKIREITTSLDRSQEEQEQLQTKKQPFLKTLRRLRYQRTRLKSKENQDQQLSQFEEEHKAITSELDDFTKQELSLSNDINLLEAQVNTTLKPEQNRVRRDIRTLSTQVKRLQKNLIQSQDNLTSLTEHLETLEASKVELTHKLSTITDERLKFEKQVDAVDQQLQNINQTFEPITAKLHHLDLELQRQNLAKQTLQTSLQTLGYAEPLDFNPREIKNINSSLDLMRFEFQQLGSINQLAPDQYHEQQQKYKQLSIRRNQLEQERKSILDFMDEIERRKREAFLEAYTQVNTNFSYFFEKLTGGGNGWLNLQNPEEPFAGGLDIFVQFPGKAARLIASASGGEKSVVAVVFIFAIQHLSPASIYLFDEIDAHLDHHNAERLANLLKEQAADSQFIVITLRDVILDRAEKLFGVYIQNGLSRVVSTKLPELVA